jgi:proteasome lid subunit RPN8/RPN11
MMVRLKSIYRKSENKFLMKKHKKHLQVMIEKSAEQMLRKDVYQRRQIEACGVLIGERDQEENWLIRQVQPLNNTFASAVYFEFAPDELLEVELRYPEQIVGVYHSHPTGYARASSTDKENMQRVNIQEGIPWVWLIVCGPFGDEGEQGIEGARILGFHHDEREGLKRVRVLLEDQ